MARKVQVSPMPCGMGPIMRAGSGVSPTLSVSSLFVVQCWDVSNLLRPSSINLLRVPVLGPSRVLRPAVGGCYYPNSGAYVIFPRVPRIHPGLARVQTTFPHTFSSPGCSAPEVRHIGRQKCVWLQAGPWTGLRMDWIAGLCLRLG